MITAVIWSKDRPSQLHLLLDSIRQNLPEVFETCVVYKSSTDEYAKAYNNLISRSHTGSIFDNYFFDENEHQGFENLTRKIIKRSLNSHIALFTDDTVIYRKSPLIGQNFIDKVKTDNAVFSLRYGFNTIVQNCHTGEIQHPLNQFIDEGETISWDFNRYHPHSNYGYPFGLDGHIFNRDLLQSIISEFSFKNTNELESNLFRYSHRIPQQIRSFKQSVAVNIPINGMSGVTRNGEQHAYSLEELNQRYLSNEVIDLDSISNNQIVGCHQELCLSFEDYE